MSSTPVLGFTLLGEKSDSCKLKLQWCLGDSARLTSNPEVMGPDSQFLVCRQFGS